ncbi:MAG: Maf-like protein [Rhizobiaceae bacterium]|nr:Maf-like protein [Rhizobiaceae bacterium]
MHKQPRDVILASGSTGRRMLLENAGVPFRVELPDVDERAIEAAIDDSGATPAELALILAEAKAIEVSLRFPKAIVIAADQTMNMGDRLFHKPADMDEARRNLIALSGHTHELNSAVVVAENGTVPWSHVDTAYMTMREISPAYVGRYLSAAGDAALKSVGSYQMEGLGAQLFDTAEGSYFTIIGLPLLPLLQVLREYGVIDG